MQYIAFMVLFSLLLGGSLAEAPDMEDEEVVERLEMSLLNMFGMEEKPQADVRQVKIPSHMRKLYKIREMQEKIEQNRIKRELGEFDDIEEENEEGELEADLNIYGNTVRSFTHIESLNDKRHEGHKMLLRFNISSIPKREDLQFAELRLFQTIHPSAIPLQNNLKKTKWHKSEMDQLQRLKVYDVIRPAKGSRSEIHRLIDTKVIDARVNGSISFDVAPAISRWIRNPRHNHGIYIELLPLKRSSNNKFIDGKHVRLRRSAEVDVDSEEWSEQQPLLVVHTDDENIKPRDRRHSGSSGYTYKKRVECKRHKLFVDFRKLDWMSWIVAPPGYEAYYCDGTCAFPLADHMNATNHAVIQSIMHSQFPLQVPKACCVATKHSAISMLYYNPDRKVVLKTYQNMIVESCGCQ